MRSLFRSFLNWEILLCLLGVAVCLIPTTPRTAAFWGLGDRIWTSWKPDRTHLRGVLPDTPAAAAGLQGGDWILEVNGQPATLDLLNRVILKVQPGSEIRLVVERDGQRLPLVGVGAEPQIEAFFYYDAQVIILAICAVLALFLFITQPLRPAPWWRTLTVLVVGLAGTVFLALSFVGPLHGGWGVLTIIRFGQSWPIDNIPDMPGLVVQIVSIIVALGLVALATLEFRTALQRRIEARRKLADFALSRPDPAAMGSGETGALAPGSEKIVSRRDWSRPPLPGEAEGLDPPSANS